MLSTQDIVGIKVYSSPGADSGTRPAVVAAIIDGLLEAKLPPRNIIVWDKQAEDLRRAMEKCSCRAMRPAAVMAALYRATLAALQRSGWRNPTARVSVSTPLKLWLVLRHGVL